MFGAHELAQLDGLPLERQVLNALIKAGKPLLPEELRPLLSPVPSLQGFDTLIGRMKATRAIADIGDRGYGLPGWLVNTPKAVPRATPVHRLVDDDDPPPQVASPTPAAPSTAGPSTQEKNMPRTKRGPRVAAKVADEAVAKVLQDMKDKLTAEQVAHEAQLTVVAATKALKRLVKAKRAVRERAPGRGGAMLYSLVGSRITVITVPADTPTKSAAETRPRKPFDPAAPDGPAKFGYFSDGSLSIECKECAGELTKAEAEALEAFLERSREARV